MRELFLSQLFSPHDTIKPLFEPRQPFEMNSRFFSTSWIFHFQRTLASLHVFPLEFIFFINFQLKHIQSDSPPTCQAFSPFVPVYPAFRSDKHPVMAVVSAEVWEEDGGFLRHHSEYTVFILVGQHRRIHIDVCAILWAKSWMQRPCVGNRSTLEKCGFTKSFKIVFLWLFPLHLVDHALHHDAGLHPQRCGGLRRGCLLWAQRGRFAPAAVVRRWEGRSHFHLYHFSVVRISTYLQKTRRKQTQAMHRTQLEYTLLGPYPNPDIATSLFAGKMIISSPFSITFKISTPPNYLL